jgi:ribonuclease-3
LLEIAYQLALPAGQANDLYQRLNRPLVDELATELSLLDFVVGAPGLHESLQTDAPLRQRIETNAAHRLLAALALAGDCDYARTLVNKAALAAETSAAAVASYKTALQELLARAKQGRPSYSVLGQDGPDHALTFHVAVTTPDGRSAEGVSSSKRKAEEQAARSYLATHWGRQLELSSDGGASPVPSGALQVDRGRPSVADRGRAHRPVRSEVQGAKVSLVLDPMFDLRVGSCSSSIS